MTLNKNVLTRAVLTTVFILLVFIVDPLGIRNAAEKHYEDHILRMWSPFYSQTVSKDITVVLLDDEFLQQIETYPVNYATLSQLLKVISAHHPQSVFFDILQHHEHSSRLNKWLKTLNSRSFPVFMASDTEYDTAAVLNDPDSLRHKISAVSQLTAVSWSGYQHYYPLSVDWQQQRMDTPALALYKSWCRITSQCSPAEQSQYLDPMIVQWSNKSALNQIDYDNIKNCIPEHMSRFKQFINITFLSLTQGLRSDQELDKQLRERCPPFLTLSATRLFESGAVKSAPLNDAIKDRVIMIGYDLSGGVDIVRSPVHGTLPGVFYHAMALDNLMTLEDDYWRVPSATGFFKLSIADMLEIVVQISTLFLVIWYRYTHLEQKQKLDTRKQIISGLMPAFIILFIILSSVLISQFILKVGAPNWYGLILIIFFDLPIFLFYLFESMKNKCQKYLTILNKFRKKFPQISIIKRKIKEHL
ncbi:CHASE2 domain-containing protein [Agarivorans sp. Z349TD_8]|uniref:CHASE2 domain-containing protein n=1 Tax=Agarivorans sp. Z349TD_8 TaxID=3421434 RepID=UPI003D7DD5F7